MLVAHDVRHSFGETAALVDVSATVLEGERVALVGPSGSGKTTLMYCMAGLIKPDNGCIKLDNTCLADLTDSDRSDLRLRSFGFVFQFAELVPELSLRENISLPLEILKVPRRECRERVRELLDLLELADHAHRRPSQVSGGQAQRAAVARAVIHRPRVIFADEPTGSLDSKTGQIVADMLFTLSRDHAISLVLVTHNHGLAARADRIMAIKDGVVQPTDLPTAT